MVDSARKRAQLKVKKIKTKFIKFLAKKTFKGLSPNNSI